MFKDNDVHLNCTLYQHQTVYACYLLNTDFLKHLALCPGIPLCPGQQRYKSIRSGQHYH